MRRLLAAALCVVALGCERRATSEVVAGDASVAAAPGAAPQTHVVRVDPALLDAGRIRLGVVVRRAAVGSMRLPADVVASVEGAAEAGTLVTGRVARFTVKEGDRVERGQVLAWLDAPEAAKAVADVVRARARVEAQAKKVARLEALVSAEATSALAVDEARLELSTARADLAAARTVAQSLGASEPPSNAEAPAIGAQVPVRSPASGIVAERAAVLGAHVTPESKLFRIVTEGRVLVDARLADGAQAAPTPGASATVQARGGKPCPGRVLAMLPEVDPATRTRKVRVEPDPSCSGLVAGAQAEVTLVSGGRDAGRAEPEVVVVPAAAVVEVRSASFAFVPVRGGYEARPVDVGVHIGDDLVVRAGLEAGEQVVVEGAVLLKGELIRGELGGEP